MAGIGGISSEGNTRVRRESRGFSGRLREHLVTVERRDWELWLLVLGAFAILASGFFLLLVPAVLLGQQTIRIQADISPQLALGLFVLALLLIVYLVRSQIEVRRLRHQSVLEVFNFEMAHAQLMIDPLTRALTRSAIEEILGREISRVQRTQSTLVFLYVDIDRLKQANSRFGHLSGDLILAETGGLLKQAIRGTDYAIRMGGDEFLLALVDTDLKGAQVVKERIQASVTAWNQNSPLPDFPLSLSIGIQQFDATRSLDEVLADADAKMYAEKHGH